MKVTGEPYIVAGRAVLGDDVELAEEDICGLFDHVRAYLAGRGRVMVPHGFDESVSGREASIGMPVIWEPEKDAFIATASREPTTENVEELRWLIEQALASRQVRPNPQPRQLDHRDGRWAPARQLELDGNRHVLNASSSAGAISASADGPDFGSYPNRTYSNISSDVDETTFARHRR